MFYIVGLFLIIVIPPLRRLVFSYIPKIPKFLYWKSIDIYRYYKNKEWLNFNGFGLYIYLGLFGKGKSISAVRHCYEIAKKYPNVTIYTNIYLNNFPQHTKIVVLKNYQQIIDAPGDSVFLIDEISSIFQARSYSSFPVALMGLLLQVRKEKKMIISTAQRFHHVDKLIRDITYTVVDCNLKFGRFQFQKFYDPYDWENQNIMNIPIPTYHHCFITTDDDRNRYDTFELINKMKKEEFISNTETLEKRGSSTTIIASQDAPKKGIVQNLKSKAK